MSDVIFVYVSLRILPFPALLPSGDAAAVVAPPVFAVRCIGSMTLRDEDGAGRRKSPPQEGVWPLRTPPVSLLQSEETAAADKVLVPQIVTSEAMSWLLSERRVTPASVTHTQSHGKHWTKQLIRVVTHHDISQDL